MSSKRPDGRPPKKNLDQRSVIAARFKVLCLDAGLKVPEVAQALQVTERTVYAWFSGKTGVPYSAYRLLRILNSFELPGLGWEGWHMHSGKLWTPEGHGFSPEDSTWWSLLVRKARQFSKAEGERSELARRVQALEESVQEARACPPEGTRPRGQRAVTRASATSRPAGAATVVGQTRLPSPLVITGRTFPIPPDEMRARRG